MVVLILPYYKDKKKARQKELDFCLKKNLSNRLIDRVVAICDAEIEVPYHRKLTVINIGRRQRFDDLFNITSDINPDGINIATNADIYFLEEDVKKIISVDYTNTVLALSRWDVTIGGLVETHYDHIDSQDSWIWKGRINVFGNFELGRAGCDNRIAYEIGKVYNIVNPSKSIKSYHFHLSEIRNYKPKDAVPPPYLRVPACYYTPRKIKKVLHIGLNAKGQSELCKLAENTR
jgi:hypothetical protein